MVEFVKDCPFLEHWGILDSHIKYAQFLSKPLELGMFIPCDEKGNILEEPMRVDFLGKRILYIVELRKWKKAKERVLFEGFEIFHHENDRISICYDNILHVFWDDENGGWITSKDLKTIEHLVKYNLPLTEKGIKESGL